jgi:hypothetical protein
MSRHPCGVGGDALLRHEQVPEKLKHQAAERAAASCSRSFDSSLMACFGIGEHYRIEVRHVRAKLIV